MVTVTISVPTELKEKMDEFGEINWSEVARRAFVQKINVLELLKEFTADSELTEEDAVRLGRKVNKALAKRYANLRTKAK